MSANHSFKIAAVQASPVFLDRDATVEKACGLIREAAGQGASLVVFPEAFVPGYPLWVWFMPSGHTHPLRELYTRLHANSVSVPDDATRRLCAEAAESGITVAIGINDHHPGLNRVQNGPQPLLAFSQLFLHLLTLGNVNRQLKADGASVRPADRPVDTPEPAVIDPVLELRDVWTSRVFPEDTLVRAERAGGIHVLQNAVAQRQVGVSPGHQLPNKTAADH